jgi:hypothetical protein
MTNGFRSKNLNIGLNQSQAINIWGKVYGLCKFLANVNRSALTKHAESVNHIRNNDIKRSTFTINHFLQKPTTPSVDCIVAKAETVLTAFVAEHNVPVSHMDHLVKCMKTAFPDSQIAQKLTLKPTKLSYVLQDGLAYSQCRNVVDRCKSQKFYVLLDESTDISVSQILAVVVRFFDTGIICSQFKNMHYASVNYLITFFFKFKDVSFSSLHSLNLTL